jgi:hypothetical protein
MSFRIMFAFAAAVAVLPVAGCEESEAATDDGGADADVADVAEVVEEVVEDAGVEDAADVPEAIVCPDVTPGTEELVLETVRTVRFVLAPPTETLLSAALCVYDPPLPWAVLLGEDGACRVTHNAAITSIEATNLDTGDITVEVDGASVMLEAADVGLPCARGPVGAIPAIEPGDTVRVWSTGGTDVPAFDLSVTVPAAPSTVAPVRDRTLVACTEWEVDWLPAAGPGPYAEFYALVDGRHFSLRCRDVAPPVRIPVTLTTLWPAGTDRASLELTFYERTATTGDDPVTLEVGHRVPADRVGVIVARPE